MYDREKNKFKNLHCTVDKFSEASDDEKSEKSKCWGVKKTTSSHPIFPSSLLIMEPAIIIWKIVKIREKSLKSFLVSNRKQSSVQVWHKVLLLALFMPQNMGFDLFWIAFGFDYVIKEAKLKLHLSARQKCICCALY